MADTDDPKATPGTGGGAPAANTDPNAEPKGGADPTQTQAPTPSAQDLAIQVADLERKKAALERDLARERKAKTDADEAARKAAEDKARTQKATLEALKAAGIDVPDGGGASDVEKKLAELEAERQQSVEAAREAVLRDLLIERELLRGLAGKVDDLDYALYRARQLESFTAVEVADGKVSGISDVIAGLTEVGVVKAADGQQPTATAPSVKGQPPVSGSKHPWREAKDWNAFLALPWAVQQEAKSKDGQWVTDLRAKHYNTN